MTVWRIATEASAHAADDLSGASAKKTGGRWNRKGTRIVYCTTNIALATLETVCYLRNGRLPFNRFLVRVDIPTALWDERRFLDPLPGCWNAIPAGLSSKRAGDHWAESASSALLLVPSVIVPDEYNVLINPCHSDVAAISAHTVKRWDYDPRFFW